MLLRSATAPTASNGRIVSIPADSVAEHNLNRFTTAGTPRIESPARSDA